MKDGELVIVATTFPDRESAAQIARLLVEGGLAACAQVGADLTAFYRWDGDIQCEDEVGVHFKVLGERFALFAGELKLQHPYDVPQIVAWNASYVDTDYLAWTRGQTT